MISLTEAAFHVLRTTDYAGKRIADVALTDAGLIDLERLAGLESVDGIDRMYLQAFVCDSGMAATIRKIQDAARARLKAEGKIE